MRRGLSTLLDSPVKLDNHLVWDGRKFPFTESYDIKLHDPKHVWSLWLRYALNHPTSVRDEAHTSLTGFFVDQKGMRLALSEKFPMDAHDIVHADHFITLKDAHFSLSNALGCIQKNNQSLRWDLLFEDPVQSLRPLPSIFYSLAAPRLKFLSPRFCGRASGQIYINHHTRDAQGLKIYQAHRYGEDPLPAFQWAHCADFNEDPTAVFEALTVDRGGFLFSKKTKKQWHVFCLVMEGEKYFSHSLVDVWRGRSVCGPLEWQIEFEKNKRRFECHIIRQPLATFGTRAVLQDGSQHHTYLSPLAALEIKVFKKQNGAWTHERTLSSQTGCTVETAGRDEFSVFGIDVNESLY